MCRDCKQNFKDQRCSLATKNDVKELVDDVKELVDAVKLQTSPNILNEELTKCGKATFAEIVKHQMSEHATINSMQAIKFASRIRKKINSDPIIQQFSRKKKRKSQGEIKGY